MKGNIRCRGGRTPRALKWQAWVKKPSWKLSPHHLPQLMLHGSETNQRPSGIPDPENGRVERYNVGSKTLNFGLFCYTAIDNQNMVLVLLLSLNNSVTEETLHLPLQDVATDPCLSISCTCCDIQRR